MILFELVALTLPLFLSHSPTTNSCCCCCCLSLSGATFVFCLYHLDFIPNINIFAGSLYDTRVEFYQQRPVSIVLPVVCMILEQGWSFISRGRCR